MYKVYYKDKTIFIGKPDEFIGKKISLVTSVKELLSLYTKFLNSRSDEIYFENENPAKIWKEFIAEHDVIEAAGGIVKNEKGQILFIYRNHKWDLPKGKIEKGEDKQNAAVREVEEECGIEVAMVIKEFSCTYHVFKQDKKIYLKKTYWFEMISTDKTLPKPQEEEGITIAKWVSPEQMEEQKENTFKSVMQVLNELEK